MKEDVIEIDYERESERETERVIVRKKEGGSQRKKNRVWQTKNLRKRER